MVFFVIAAPNDEEFGREFPSINSHRIGGSIHPPKELAHWISLSTHDDPPPKEPTHQIVWKFGNCEKACFRCWSGGSPRLHRSKTPWARLELGFFWSQLVAENCVKLLSLLRFWGRYHLKIDGGKMTFLCHFRCYVRFRDCTWESFSNWGFLEQAPKTDLNNHSIGMFAPKFFRFCRFWKNLMGTARLKAHHLPPNCCFSMQFSPQKLISDHPIFRCCTAWENPWLKTL